MANSINTSISQLYKANTPGTVKSGAIGRNPRGPSGTESAKAAAGTNPFGDSVKFELSPEVEMYGKAVDLLQSKYDNAEVFVAGPGDDLSQIGGDLEYSIILDEDE